MQHSGINSTHQNIGRDAQLVKITKQKPDKPGFSLESQKSRLKIVVGVSETLAAMSKQVAYIIITQFDWKLISPAH